MSKKERAELSPVTDLPTLDELKNLVFPEYLPAKSKEEIQDLLDSPKIKNMLKWLSKIKADEGKPIDDLPTLDNLKAYPNNENQYMHIPGQRNVDKWITAIKEMISKENNGLDNKTALSQVTDGWNEVEIQDFIHWFKYYQEGAHLKYKYAQFFYGDADRGYMLPIAREPKVEAPPPQNIEFVNGDSSDADDGPSNKEIIEKQRNKIIGRLDSAEKLLRSEEGQMFSGKEFESLLEAIYDLKKRVQLINKRSSSTRIYEDLIVRQANILNKKGFIKAAGMLNALAEDTKLQSAPDPTADMKDKQEAPKKAPQGGKMPPAASPAPPAQSSGAPGSLPSMGPGSPQTPPESAPNNPPKPEEMVSPGINEFMQKLNTGVADSASVDDVLEVQDQEEDLVVEAQLAPDAPPIDAPPPAAPKAPAPPPALAPDTEAPLEVTEDDIKPEDGVTAPAGGGGGEGEVSAFDARIDAVFSNLQISDVVAKLEDLAKVFKTREIPRQLAIVDMMLDQLGLASFFPSLSEATNKALESNNYISTRVEDIISKLRGSMATHDIDLKGNEVEQNPEVAAVKNKLQQDADKEKSRKDMRKQQENEDLENKSKETPEIEVTEDLGAPAEAPKPAAPPPKPPGPPAV